jgi:type IV pilus assembly protein PilA
MNNARGFTLVELMIVVAIIAVLAAIATAQYQDYVIRSQVSEGISLADGAKTAVGEFFDNNGRFPPTNSSAGLASAASIKGQYVSQVSLTPGFPGLILIQYNGPKASLKLKAGPKFLAFSAVSNAGSIEWHCLTPTIGAPANMLPQKWCPSSCLCNG